MSQDDFATIGKFIIATIGYFIGTGVMGFVISLGQGDEDAFPLGAWAIGGIAFGILAVFG